MIVRGRVGIITNGRKGWWYTVFLSRTINSIVVVCLFVWLLYLVWKDQQWLERHIKLQLETFISLLSHSLCFSDEEVRTSSDTPELWAFTSYQRQSWLSKRNTLITNFLVIATSAERNFPRSLYSKSSSQIVLIMLLNNLSLLSNWGVELV